MKKPFNHIIKLIKSIITLVPNKVKNRNWDYSVLHRNPNFYQKSKERSSPFSPNPNLGNQTGGNIHKNLSNDTEISSKTSSIKDPPQAQENKKKRKRGTRPNLRPGRAPHPSSPPFHRGDRIHPAPVLDAYCRSAGGGGRRNRRRGWRAHRAQDPSQEKRKTSRSWSRRTSRRRRRRRGWRRCRHGKTIGERKKRRRKEDQRAEKRKERGRSGSRISGRQG